MAGDSGKIVRARDLRRRAEDCLATGANREAGPSAAAKSIYELAHELSVHQTELEMQNDELVRSRAELEASLERYSDLYDFAPIGYLTLERDGSIRELNLAAAAQLGFERLRLVGRRFGQFVGDADRTVFNAALDRAFGAEMTEECEISLAPVKPGGESQYVHLRLARDTRRETCRVAAVDVTARRRAEDHLRVSLRLEAIGLLAGGVAHDFNNLLTIISTHAELALQKAREIEPLRQDLVELKAAATRAAALTRVLLAFGGKQMMHPSRIDVNQIALGLASMLRTLLGPRIDLVLDLSNDVGWVELDVGQLEQVIVNLAANARDAMPDGGTFTLSTSNVEVRENGPPSSRMLKDGSFVRMIARDTGLGIDEGTLTHVFEPFFTTKPMGQGTGLGLASVYGFVKQSGGEITVHSEVGKGAAFEIYFPRAAAPPEVGGEDAGKLAASTGDETILIVDDEDRLRSVAKQLLAAAGYSVIEASSGPGALELCERHRGRIHLALTDVVMARMTGVEFAQRLKPIHPETKILYMSGYAHGDLPRMGAGNDFIHKPFTIEELRAKVRAVLDAPAERAPGGPTSYR